MINKIKRLLLAFIKDESGQDLIESALVSGVIGLGTVAVTTSLSSKIVSAFFFTGYSRID